MLKLIFLALFSSAVGAATFEVHPGLTTSKAWLTELAQVVSCVSRQEALIIEVARSKPFTHTKDAPGVVAKKMLEDQSKVVFSTYRSRPFSKTIAYRNVGSNIVYFNTRKNPRDTAQMVNTGIHEWLHVAGYGHGSNSAKGKGESVNYAVGKMAEKYVQFCTKGGK